MRFKPMHMISTILFIASFGMSIIGPWTRGTTNAFLAVWAVLTLIVGWIFHIIGCVKK